MKRATPPEVAPAEAEYVAALAKFGITPTMYDSPRWALVDRPSGQRVCVTGGKVPNPPDPSRLSGFLPALEAWKDCPKDYRGLVFVPLTDAELALAPDADPAALAAHIWSESWFARKTPDAAALADSYKFEAAQAEARGDMDEARDYRSLADEYEAQAELDRLAPPAPAPLSVATDDPYTLTDVGTLMDTKFDPLVFLTSGAIELAAGAYFLAGKPKHGKSWLAMGMAVSICTGEEYLGTTPAEKGQAIYLACDDSSERRFQDRVRKIGPQGSLAGLMGLVTKWAPEAKSTIAVLDEVAGRYPRLRLVVVDTLSAFRNGVRNDSPYQQEYDEVKALNDWAHIRGVIVLIVHHLRKGVVDPNDPFESISGTLGLQGAADGMMVLSRVDDHDDLGATDRQLAGLWMRGRDIEGNLSMGLELKNGRWHAIGTATDVYQAGTNRLILQLLREANGRWMTSKELHASGQFDCKQPSVQKAASRMAARGEIESHRGALQGQSGGGGGFRSAP